MRWAGRVAVVGWWCGLMILGVAAGGCGSKPADGRDAMARVGAAAQIGNPSERDTALESACRDAADVGAGDAVRKGLLAIGNPTLRDEVAVDCALKLRDGKQGAAANDVARLVGNPTSRDALLKRLSSGA